MVRTNGPDLPGAQAEGGDVSKLPPYPSLYIARCAMDQKFPHHEKTTKKGTEQDTEKVERLQQIHGQMRRLALELAAVEIELKERIGFHEGLELPEGKGILLWTSATSPRRSRINWMQLVHDFKISEETLKKYHAKNDGQRRLTFKRKAHGPSGIDNLKPTTEQINLDDDL